MSETKIFRLIVLSFYTLLVRERFDPACFRSAIERNAQSQSALCAKGCVFRSEENLENEICKKKKKCLLLFLKNNYDLTEA